MKNEKPCDQPGADYGPYEFENYEAFYDWVFEEGQDYRRKHLFRDGFFLKTEPGVIYKYPMDCVRAHEEA